MARTFDGTDDEITHTDIAAMDGAAALTIMLWMATDEAAHGTNDGFIGKAINVGTQGFSYVTNISGDGVKFRWFIGGLNHYDKNSMFPDTAFHHLTSVFDGAGAANADRLKIYLDGVNQTATGFVGTIPATISDAGTAPFRIGKGANNFGFGAMSAAHLKIWTAALSQGEIGREMYSYTPQRTRDLLLWVPYDNGTANDYSGNGFHGTITEATESTGPSQVLYGNAVTAPTRNQRGTRRSNLQGFRRLGPHVPLITRGI